MPATRTQWRRVRTAIIILWVAVGVALVFVGKPYWPDPRAAYAASRALPLIRLGVAVAFYLIVTRVGTLLVPGLRKGELSWLTVAGWGYALLFAWPTILAALSPHWYSLLRMPDDVIALSVNLNGALFGALFAALVYWEEPPRTTPAADGIPTGDA